MASEEPADQQRVTNAMIINGAHAVVTAAQMKAVSAANTVFTFTATHVTHTGGTTRVYRKGVPYHVDAITLARLQAASAPLVAA